MPVTPINQVQGSAYTSGRVGSRVTVEGVVVARRSNQFWMAVSGSSLGRVHWVMVVAETLGSGRVVEWRMPWSLCASERGTRWHPGMQQPQAYAVP